MRKSEAPSARAASDKLPLLYRHHLRSHQPCVADPAAEGERQNEIQKPWPQERHERNRQQNSRQRQERIRHINVQDHIRRPAVEPRQRPCHQPHRQRQPHHRDRHDQRNPRPIQRPRQNVPPQFIGPKQMCRRRPRHAIIQIQSRRVTRREPRRQYRAQHKPKQQRHPHRRQRLPPRKPRRPVVHAPTLIFRW